MPRANWTIGYGLVNHWHQIDPVPFAKALKRAGCNFTAIEWIPWFETQPCDCKKTGGSDKYGGCQVKPFPKQAQAFVAAMTAKGIHTMVIQENRNSCACRSQPDDYRRTQLKKILKLTEHGIIWYCPFGEPWVQSSGTLEFVQHAQTLVPPYVPFVVPDKGKNTATKQPYWNVPFNYLDVHPCNDDAVNQALRAGHPVLVNTDCTGTLNPGPTRAKKWTQLSAQTKTALHVYDFKGTSFDQSVLDAMGSVIKGGS